jgi:beta-lactam-binding protein with PASTA domain
MNEGVTISTEEMTEEQAKAEVERMGREIQFLLEQIKRGREEGQRISARTDAKMAEVRAALAHLEASR